MTIVFSEILKQKFPQAILSAHQNYGDDTVVVDLRYLTEVLGFCKSNQECPFDLLLDLCGVDFLGEEPRFEVVYHLYSLKKTVRLRLKVRVHENNLVVPSVMFIWEAADWFEREAFDMYGIHFEGHPKLKRLLMWEEFCGHPLRKDYPLGKRQPIPEPLDIV